jgi:hypothetical protein
LNSGNGFIVFNSSSSNPNLTSTRSCWTIYPANASFWFQLSGFSRNLTGHPWYIFMGTDRRIFSEGLVCAWQTYMFLGPEKRQLHAALLFSDRWSSFRLVTECRYFSGGLIELKFAIRGSLGTLGPREIKKKKDAFVCAKFWGHQRVHWPSLRHIGT